MKVQTKKVIEVSDWDALVTETYGRPYCFQQQDGCMTRGTVRFTVPDARTDDAGMHDEIPEITNHDTMGVKFDKWLERDPATPLNGGAMAICDKQWAINLWWHRNFYPDLQTVANDLHAKGLLEAGDYLIDID